MCPVPPSNREFQGKVTGPGQDAACPTERGGTESIPGILPITCSSTLRISLGIRTEREVSPPDLALAKLPSPLREAEVEGKVQNLVFT